MSWIHDAVSRWCSLRFAQADELDSLDEGGAGEEVPDLFGSDDFEPPTHRKSGKGTGFPTRGGGEHPYHIDMFRNVNGEW